MAEAEDQTLETEGFTDEQRDFIERANGSSNMTMKREQMIPALRILYSATNADRFEALELATDEELKAIFADAIQDVKVDFMKLVPDIRFAILALADNRTIHKICSASNAVSMWCMETEAFDRVFENRYGTEEFDKFLARHPDNELPNGLWRLRAYEYVKAFQLFHVSVEIKQLGAAKHLNAINGMRLTSDQTPAQYFKDRRIKLTYRPIEKFNQDPYNRRNSRIRVEYDKLYDILKRNAEIFKIRRFHDSEGVMHVGTLEGTVAQMERLMFRFFDSDVVLLDHLDVQSADDKEKTQLHINCSMCGKPSSLRCKMCKGGHACSKKCHLEHGHRCQF